MHIFFLYKVLGRYVVTIWVYAKFFTLIVLEVCRVSVTVNLFPNYNFYFENYPKF